ncbi:MFS transporter [Acinetobacter pittii]|uniref:MFS transporter n=1 Tax=Acinetobacter pittii TaxID=48296 RepID=UPI00249ED248|nr:MFS transporter [Acinetobacter pittii]WHA53459.1 putative MFS-type transporter [Acinetobacter pittii]
MKTIDKTIVDFTAPQVPPPNSLIFLLACACGLIVANLYYAQPLIGLIAPDIHLTTTVSGLIVTLTQIGYCLGLLLLVPLSDLLENRKLFLFIMSGGVLTLVIAAFSKSVHVFLFSCFLIGFGSISAQILVLIVAHMTPIEFRGRVVGKVMSGLFIGIMLSRPISSFIAASFGWRFVYILSSVIMVILIGMMWRLLPSRIPKVQHNYYELIGSLWHLLRDTSELRRRAAYQATLFASFSLFWTAVPLILASPRFNLTQKDIGLFSLVGVAGAVAGPIAGWLADQGKSHLMTGLSITMVFFSFLLAWFGGTNSLGVLLVSAVLLDFGVQANLVVGQRVIFSLGEHIRGRLNALFIALFFLGGAVGSASASISYVYGGWPLVCMVGIIFPLLSLLLYKTERVNNDQ